MKRITSSRLFKICIGTVVICLILCSCTANKSGRKHLERILFSDYAAEIEYQFKFNDTSLSGNGRITREETVRLDILSPDPYTGISVQGDISDKIETVSISYSSIKADVPKNVLNKLSLVLSMFSDTASCAVENANTSDFVKSESEYSPDFLNECVPYEVCFMQGETEYIYTYDSITGIPVYICAKTKDLSVDIKIKKFKTEQ